MVRFLVHFFGLVINRALVKACLSRLRGAQKFCGFALSVSRTVSQREERQEES